MRIGIASGDRISASRSQDKQPHWGGSGWARFGQYIPYLPTEVIVGSLVWHYDSFKIMTDDDVMMDVDVILTQRLMHEGLDDHTKMARAVGQIVINDVDDWYWGLDPSNMAWKTSHPKYNKEENINFYKKIVCASSIITVSTPFLRDRILQWNPKCDVVLLPNTVDTRRFTKHDHTETTTPKVGWVGSTAHRSGDLEILRGILAPLSTTTQISLQHSGFSLSAPSFAEAVGVDYQQVTNVPATDPENYPSLLSMDVGIAPLRDVPFNHAKSDIKLLEYSASGIPWIASALPSYVSLQESFQMGRIAKRPKDWIRNLKALRDPKVRAEEGDALYELVKKRDIGVGVEAWSELLAL